MPIVHSAFSESKFFGADGSRREANGKIMRWMVSDLETRTKSPVPCLAGPFLVGKSWLIERSTTKKTLAIGLHDSPLQLGHVKEFAERQLREMLETKRLRPYARILESILFDSLESPKQRLDHLKHYKDKDLALYYLGCAFLEEDIKKTVSNLSDWLKANQGRMTLYVRTTHTSQVSDLLCSALHEKGLAFLLERWYLMPVEPPKDYPPGPVKFSEQKFNFFASIPIFALTISEALGCIQRHYEEAFPEQGKQQMSSDARRIFEYAGTHPGFCANLAHDWYNAVRLDDTLQFEKWFSDVWITENLNSIRTWLYSLPRDVHSIALGLLKKDTSSDQLEENDRIRLCKHGILIDLLELWLESLPKDISDKLPKPPMWKSIDAHQLKESLKKMKRDDLLAGLPDDKNKRWKVPELIESWWQIEEPNEINRVREQMKESVKSECDNKIARLHRRLEELEERFPARLEAHGLDSNFQSLETERNRISNMITRIGRVCASAIKKLDNAKTNQEIEKIYQELKNEITDQERAG